MRQERRLILPGPQNPDLGSVGFEGVLGASLCTLPGSPGSPKAVGPTVALEELPIPRQDSYRFSSLPTSPASPFLSHRIWGSEGKSVAPLPLLCPAGWWLCLVVSFPSCFFLSSCPHLLCSRFFTISHHRRMFLSVVLSVNRVSLCVFMSSCLGACLCIIFHVCIYPCVHMRMTPRYLVSSYGGSLGTNLSLSMCWSVLDLYVVLSIVLSICMSLPVYLNL